MSQSSNSYSRRDAAMQRCLLRLCASAVIILFGYSQVLAQQSPAGIIVDGKSDDWSGITLAHDKTNTLEYAAVLDGGQVHVFLRTGSPTMQAKILKAGMTVYFDIEGKKKASTGIVFPLPKPDEEGDMAATNLNAARTVGLAKSTEFTLRKFRDGNGTFKVGEAMPGGVVVAVNYDAQGNLVYESGVPFELLYGKPAPEAADAGKSLDVGYVINALPEPPALPSAEAGGTGGTPVGGVAFPRGSRGGGQAGQGLPDAAPKAGTGRETQGSVQEAYRSTKVWTSIAIK